MKSIDELQIMMNMKMFATINKLDSEGNPIVVKNKLEERCTDGEIKKIQNELQIEIPKQYTEFLLKYNGAKLFDYDGVDGLNLLSIQDILKYTLYASNTFEEDWISNIIIFGKIIGEDSYLGFKVNENEKCQIVDCYFEELPIDWNCFDLSFDEFLLRYISGKGNKFWIEY